LSVRLPWERSGTRKACEIGLTVIPVFALAFLVSERDKLQIPLGEGPPPGESPEESAKRG
jgi:hypothetical protein